MTLPSYLDSFLEQPFEAVFSTLGPRGYPQQTVMWFLRRGDTFVMTTLAKRVKVANLREHNQASLLIVGPGAYASFQGEVQIENDRQLAQENFRQLTQKYASPERQELLLKKLTDPTRVTLTFMSHAFHSHRVKSWNS